MSRTKRPEPDSPETVGGAASVAGELLTSGEVAALFGVDRRTVLLWVKEGRLHARRTPGGHHRFPAAEIHRLRDAPNAWRGRRRAKSEGS